MLGWRYKDTDLSKFVGWGYQNPINSATLTLNTVAWTGFGTLVFFPGNTMKGFYVLTSFRGWVLSWLATLDLDRGNDRSFDIYYHNFPMGTYLKHFIKAYLCLCWMKSTSIDGLDVPYIRPWWCQNYLVN